MDSLSIGVFFGGKSPEHDISIITGELIVKGLQGLGYNVIPIYIDRGGKWFIGEKLGDLSFFQSPVRNFKGLGEYVLDFEASNAKMVFRKKGWHSKTYTIDLAFPALHGRNGEDGTIQGLFEMVNIPYAGCDVPSSAIAIDKVLTKLFYQTHEFETTKFLFFHKREWEAGREEVLEKIKTGLRPVRFVKPARLGSSIGVTKARDEKELIFAMEVAFHYDEKIIVEEAVEKVADITCCVIGNENPTASALQESLFVGSHFSYEDKYLKQGCAQFGKAESNLIIPARLDRETTEKIRKTAIEVFLALGCSGIARVDFLYDSNSKMAFVNEINTLPGTLYHHLWKASGIELDELLRRLITFAEERHAKKRDIRWTFDSDVLRQVNWSQKLQSKQEKGSGIKKTQTSLRDTYDNALL